MTKPRKNYRYNNFGDDKVKAMLAARRHVMESARAPVLFICWRDGASQPASYHTDEAAARAAAERFIKARQTICILRAEIVTTANAGAPAVTFIDRKGRGV